MRRTIARLLLVIIFVNIVIPFSAAYAAGETLESSSISILSNTDGGLLYIDGKDTGLLTPLTEPVVTKPGFHRLRIEKEGHTTWRKELLLSPGEAMTLSAVLLPLDVTDSQEEAFKDSVESSSIFVLSNVGGAKFYIDSKDSGLVTPIADPVTINSGFHSLSLEKEGYTTWRKELLLSPGEAMTLSAILFPIDVTESQKEAFKGLGKKPITKTWWFWTLVLAGIVAAIAAEDADDDGTVLVTW